MVRLFGDEFKTGRFCCLLGTSQANCRTSLRGQLHNTIEYIEIVEKVFKGMEGMPHPFQIVVQVALERFKEHGMAGHKDCMNRMADILGDAMIDFLNKDMPTTNPAAPVQA